MKFWYLLLFSVCSFSSIRANPAPGSVVKFHETYELANIILAITEHGKTDKNEVNKNSAYYQEVLAHFDKFSNHPLIQKVNYSRALWDKLLSFRTDAVAFEFDQAGNLQRKHKFYAMGKEINEFENNLDLIVDFARKSEFRTFYAGKKSYFDELAVMYENSLMVTQIEAFLTKEFERKVSSKHQIIVSPLVGRMHCQRPFNNASTSFINIPDYLFTSKKLSDISKKDLASGVHMFFTEVDHDYVNPTTRKFKKLYKTTFNPAKWDKESGYQNSSFATFNEYMTWAVFDVFIQQHFPEVAPEVSTEWHKINESRGFFASQFFGKKLQDLYAQKSQQETILDLYPKILNWCSTVENDLGMKTKK